MSALWPGHQHSHGESLIRRLPAALKLAVALAIIIVTVLAPIDWKMWFAGVVLFLFLGPSTSGLKIRSKPNFSAHRPF